MKEQWDELKETIAELRDNNGIATQQEVCKFLANYMDVLEKQVIGHLSNVDTFKVNGKAFISVDRILEIIGEEQKRWVMPTPDEERVLWWAYNDLRHRIRAFEK